MEIEGLAVVCAGLGCAAQYPSSQGLSYVKSDNCLENLKDLQRFLRRDHPKSRDVFKQLGKWNTVGQDLVPIITQYRNDSELVINAVKVVVFLTMPVDSLSDDIPEQRAYLWTFKAAFLDTDALAVIVTLLEEPLDHLESNTFSEDDWKVVQLVLTLFRNLLDTEDPPARIAAAGIGGQFLFIKDRLLECLFQEDVMELLLALAHNVAGSHGLLRHDNLLLVEIFHHIFWGQRPEVISDAHTNILKNKPSQPASGQLRVMMEEEKEQLRSFRLKELSRHSRFSGMFVRVAEDGSKKILKRNPFQSPIENVLRGPRFKHGPVKRIACDQMVSFTSKEKVIVLLNQFADQILAGGYNVLMQSVKEDIRREQTGIQTADVILFFEVAQFFTSYQRQRVSNSKVKESNIEAQNSNDCGSDHLFQGQLCGPIALTMDEDMFTMVISKWHEFSDSAKENNDWMPLSVTGALVKEMIRMLDLVLKTSSEQSKEQEVRVARILLYKVFYDQTEKGILHFLLHRVKSFDIHKQPRSHLADLVETIHVVLRLLEVLTKADGALRVLKKARKKKKNRKMLDIPSEQATTDEMGLPKEITEPANGIECTPDVDLSGNSSGISPKAENIVRDDLRNDKEIIAECALADDLSRNSLNVPVVTEDVAVEASDVNFGVSKDFGHNKLATIEAVITFEGGKENEVKRRGRQVAQDMTKNESLLDEEEENEEDEEDHVEVSLDLQRCVAIFADNTVVRNYCWLLKYYNSNSVTTNHYIVRMLQRICEECDMEPMLYQLSLLRIFYEILSDKKISKSEEHKNLVSFVTKFIRSLCKRLRSQPFLFVEILFWKTRQDCHLISTDYILHKVGREHGRGPIKKKICIADALGDDEIDGIPRSGPPEDDQGSERERAVHTLEKAKFAKTKTRTKGGLFSAEQEAKIKELFEQYKDSHKCSIIIAEELDPDGKLTAAQVGCKLRQLGLSSVAHRRKIGGQINDDEDGDLDDTQRPQEDAAFCILPDHGKDDGKGKVRGNPTTPQKSKRKLERKLKRRKKPELQQIHDPGLDDNDNLEPGGNIGNKAKKVGNPLQKPKRVVTVEVHDSDEETLQVLVKRMEQIDDPGHDINDRLLREGSGGNIAKKPKNIKHERVLTGEEDASDDEETLQNLFAKRMKSELQQMHDPGHEDNHILSKEGLGGNIVEKAKKVGISKPNHKRIVTEGLGGNIVEKAKKVGTSKPNHKRIVTQEEKASDDDEPLQNLFTKRMKPELQQIHDFGHDDNDILLGEGGGENIVKKTKKVGILMPKHKQAVTGEDQASGDEELLQNLFAKPKHKKTIHKKFNEMENNAATANIERLQDHSLAMRDEPPHFTKFSSSTEELQATSLASQSAGKQRKRSIHRVGRTQRNDQQDESHEYHLREHDNPHAGEDDSLEHDFGAGNRSSSTEDLGKETITANPEVVKDEYHQGIENLLEDGGIISVGKKRRNLFIVDDEDD